MGARRDINEANAFMSITKTLCGPPILRLPLMHAAFDAATSVKVERDHTSTTLLLTNLLRYDLSLPLEPPGRDSALIQQIQLGIRRVLALRQPEERPGQAEGS